MRWSWIFSRPANDGVLHHLEQGAGHLGPVNGEAQLVTCEFDRRSSG
jgi:hypothetical protein